jgi:hypothetical protein
MTTTGNEQGLDRHLRVGVRRRLRAGSAAIESTPFLVSDSATTCSDTPYGYQALGYQAGYHTA